MEKKKWISRIITGIAVVVMVFSGYKVVSILLDYKESADAYKSTATSYTTTNDQDTSNDNSTENSGDPSVDSSVAETKEEIVQPPITVDFASLKEKNEDVVGWIYFENIDINYPIMQGTDNDYYLHHTFDRVTNPSASIFMDYENSSDFSDENTVIYGHNMRDKSMFAKLNNYREEEYYKESAYFWIFTKTGSYRYKIFSAHVVSDTGKEYTISFEDKSSYQDFLDGLVSSSLYDTGLKPTSKENIVSLSTCTSSSPSDRFVVHGKCVEKILADEEK